MSKDVLALDFGASSGRAMIGRFDGDQITLQEAYRFPNDPVTMNSVLYWDFLRLLHEIKQSLIAVKKQGVSPLSLGIDTWGIDFGLLDENGHLLENPRHYRNTMGSGAREGVLSLIPGERLYSLTGLEFTEFNTIFQLYNLQRLRPELLSRAHRLLLMPDLFNYCLTGSASAEYTIATTTQLVNVRSGDWDSEVLSSLGISRELFAPIVPPGSPAGQLSDALCGELGISPIPVISTLSHDTHAAFAAAASPEASDEACISCGTWSLLGRVIPQPVLHETAFTLNFSNEGTLGGQYNLVKSMTGLWMLQESRRQWRREGLEYSFDRLQELAIGSLPFTSMLDPDAQDFVAPGDMPGRIRAFAKRTGQTVPETDGEVTRSIFESLALKYRYLVDQMEQVSGQSIKKVRIIGGGSQDTLLCRMAANALGRPVYAGPVEATALGNMALQFCTAGVFPDMNDARDCISRSFPAEIYEPQDQPEWETAYSRYREFMQRIHTHA